MQLPILHLIFSLSLYWFFNETTSQIVVIIGIISTTTFGCISSSRSGNISYSKKVETDTIVISIVESQKDNAKKFDSHELGHDA